MGFTRFTIAFDFDDVLFDFNGYFSRWHNKHYGTNVQYEWIHSYHMPTVYGESEAILKERVQLFLDDCRPEHTVPMEGVTEIVRYLNQRHELAIVTSRNGAAKTATYDWSDYHFPALFKWVHFTNTFAPSLGEIVRTKADVCEEIGASFLFEDSAEHATIVARTSVRVFVPVRPWNRRALLPSSVIRFHSWPDIKEHF